VRLVAIVCLLWTWCLGFCSELPFVPSKRWAIVVGANEYAEMGRLSFAARDAQRFASKLQNQYRFEASTISLFTDLPNVGKPPTSENVLGELDRVLADKRLDQSDLFVFFFAGHGIGTPRGDFLLPTDATKANAEEVGIPIKALIARIVKAGLRNVLFIADACRGGDENAFGAELQELGRTSNIAVLLGCAPGKRSYEYQNVRHGAFTYCLLQAMDKQDLRDPRSGALWASRVGQEVAEQVEAFTRPSYGDAAQKPSLWSERTQDVMLGAFVPSQPGEAIKAFVEQAGALKPEQHAAALAGYAESLFEADRYEDAVEMLKTLEQLDRITPTSYYTFGVSLGLIGRLKEADRVFGKLLERTDDPYLRNLAILSNQSRTTTPSVKIAAARELMQSDGGFTAWQLAWSATIEVGKLQEKRDFLRRSLELPTFTERTKYYIRAEQAALDGDYLKSLELLRLCAQAESQEPVDMVVYSTQIISAVQSGVPEELAKVIEDAEKALPNSGLWTLSRARLFKNAGRIQDMLADLKACLAKDLSPYGMLQAVRIAGIRSIVIADAVKAKAENHPFAWQARLALALSDGLRQEQDQREDVIESAFKYSDDPLSFIIEAITILNEMMWEGVELGVIPRQTLGENSMAFFDVLLGQVEKFGYDAACWNMLFMLGFESERTEQLALLMDRYFPKKDLEPSLKSLAVITYLNVARYDDAIRLAEEGGFSPEDLADQGWYLAMAYAIRGEQARAVALIPKLPKSSDMLAEQVEAFKLVMDVREKKEGALERLKAAEPGSIAAHAWKGIAWAEQGDWERAEPLLSLSRTDRSMGFTFVHMKALTLLHDRMRATGRDAEADDLAFELHSSQFSNPLVETIHYGKSGAGEWDGKYTWEARMFIPGVGQNTGVQWIGDMNLTIKDGLVVGGVTIEGALYPITGRVDGYGNLSAQWTMNGLTGTMQGKMAQASYYGKYPKFDEGAQVFQFFEPNLARQIIFARPKKTS